MRDESSAQQTRSQFFYRSQFHFTVSDDPPRVHISSRRQGGVAAQRGAAADKIARVGIIDDAPIWDHFRQGLREAGHVEARISRLNIARQRDNLTG
jgi:hypothetical protein